MRALLLVLLLSLPAVAGAQSADREGNMQVFTRRALELLASCLRND